MAHFTDTVPIQKPGEPSIARLSHILDIAPVNVSDVTPMALVLEVLKGFSFLGEKFHLRSFENLESATVWSSAMESFKESLLEKTFFIT